VALLFYQGRALYISYQTFCREVDGRRRISHPNLLPVIEVSETLFPFCIMTPWMLDGNIVQYTRVNPDANRLMLVRAHQPESQPADYADNSYRKRARASCIFMGWTFYTAA
jgi:hypothetical protein